MIFVLKTSLMAYSWRVDDVKRRARSLHISCDTEIITLTHRWTSQTAEGKRTWRNRTIKRDIVTTQVRSEEGKNIFHNFVDFHFIFGARASQRILLVRDENKKSIAQPSPLSRSNFFHKKTHTHEIIFPARTLNGVFFGWKSCMRVRGGVRSDEKIEENKFLCETFFRLAMHFYEEFFMMVVAHFGRKVGRESLGSTMLL